MTQTNKLTYKSMYTTHLIAICHIIDDFGEFNNYISKNYTEMFASNLQDISDGKLTLCSSRTKKFYRDNKQIIGIIKNYDSIYNFLYYNYEDKNNSSIIYFYDYILKNKDNLDQILSSLEKIQKLGFKFINLNENIESYKFEEEKIKTLTKN